MLGQDRGRQSVGLGILVEQEVSDRLQRACHFIFGLIALRLDIVPGGLPQPAHSLLSMSQVGKEAVPLTGRQSVPAPFTKFRQLKKRDVGLSLSNSLGSKVDLGVAVKGVPS